MFKIITKIGVVVFYALGVSSTYGQIKIWQYVGDSTGISIGSATFLSLAFNKLGTPYEAYSE